MNWQNLFYTKPPEGVEIELKLNNGQTFTGYYCKPENKAFEGRVFGMPPGRRVVEWRPI